MDNAKVSNLFVNKTENESCEGASANMKQVCEYSLKIIIESIKLVKDTNVIIRFYNPKRQKLYTCRQKISVLNNEITFLEDVCCRMYIECSPTDIADTLKHFHPIITLLNDKHDILSQCFLKLDMFKLSKQRERTFVTKLLYVHETKEKEIAGEMSISLTMTNHNLEVSLVGENTVAATSGLPVMLEVADKLEVWKERQKEIFRKQEKEQMDLRIKQWELEKESLQNKLLENLQKSEKMMEVIKAERDNFKVAIQVEMAKRNIHAVPKILPAQTQAQTQARGQEQNKARTLLGNSYLKQSLESVRRELREIQKLKNVIQQQNSEIEKLRDTFGGAEQMLELHTQVEHLKVMHSTKTEENDLLKQYFVKTVREFNKHKHVCRDPKPTLPAAMQPAASILSPRVQMILDRDQKEQQRDKDQLSKIRKELHVKENTTELKPGIANLEREKALLLNTGTYRPEDKVIQLIDDAVRKASI